MRLSRRDLLKAAVLGGSTFAAGGLSACTPARTGANQVPSGSAGISSSGTSTGPPLSIAPVATPTAPTPAAAVPPVLDVITFGAVGDGKTDDTDALVKALGALQSGQALRFGAGKTFTHRSVLTVKTPGVQLLGPGTLLATNEQASALQIYADRVVVDGVTLAISATTKRWSTLDQHKLVIGGQDGVVVRNVTIQGSAAAGVFCHGSSNFLLDGVQVHDTRADGIHLTNGSHDGTIRSPVIARSGDDGVAVVSYYDDKELCQRILVSNPSVDTTTGGRGLSVVGGQNVTYRDISVANSFAAAVYIACEGGDSVTHSTRGVRVIGGKITGANTDQAIDHGAVLVYSGRSGGEVSDVAVSGVTVTNTRASASRQIGVVVDGAATVAGVVFADLRLQGNPEPYQGNGPASAIGLRDVTADGTAVTGPA